MSYLVHFLHHKSVVCKDPKQSEYSHQAPQLKNVQVTINLDLAPNTSYHSPSTSGIDYRFDSGIDYSGIEHRSRSNSWLPLDTAPDSASKYPCKMCKHRNYQFKPSELVCDTRVTLSNSTSRIFANTMSSEHDPAGHACKYTYSVPPLLSITTKHASITI